MILTPLLLAVAFAPQDAVPPPQPAPQAALPKGHVHPVQHLVQVQGSPRELTELQRRAFDVISQDFVAGTSSVLVDAAELQLLDELGMDWSIEIEDLAGHYARRLAGGGFDSGSGRGSGSGSTQRALGGLYAQGLNPTFGQGAIGGYYSFPEIESILDQLSASYPQILTQKVSIGTTIEGRNIWMVKVSDNPGVDESEPEVRIDAMHHAREPQGMQTTLYFLSYLLEEYGNDPVATYLVNEREIYFVPCVNPDGYEHNRSIAPGGGGLWRKNRRNNGDGTFGVDLNRNYAFQWGGLGTSNSTDSEIYRGPSPSSEPETTAMSSFLASRTFSTALSVHTFSDLWLAPWGYVQQFPPDWPTMQEIGDLATEVNGYQHGPASIVLYEAAGTTVDHDYGVHGTYSWTPEIGSGQDGFWPAQSRILPLAQDNLLAFTRTALAGGAWIRPLDAGLFDAGDGDGSFEAGESVSVFPRVRNNGRVASGAVTLGLTSSSPDASTIGGSQTVTVAPNETASPAMPLTLAIAPGTPAGTVIPFTVTVTEGGRTDVIDGELTVGVRIVASFGFEATGNQGWSVGAPNDASTGEWTRGDPVGTAAQPELDASPAPGTDCWFTGQGSVGGGLGDNDVDGGSTALLSPAFDLDGAETATIEYSRWYSNDAGGSPNADVFDVELSDDGGASWVLAESVGPAGPGTSGGWIEAEVTVESFVNLTSNVRVRFIASDVGGGSIVEAAIDEVRVVATDPIGCQAPTTYCVLTPNNWTAGAEIGAVGSTDVNQNNLTLTVANANPSGFGLFFYGQGRAQSAQGNGFICIGGGFSRLPVVSTDFTGFATHVLDFPGLSAPILNGETWNFQFWLRDIGGAGFNFSNGLEITFCQ